MKFVQARYYTPANRKTVTLIVLHTAECAEVAKADEAVAAYFAGPDTHRASAHYTVDVDSITQSVLEKDIAWHAGPVNNISIGIEHAGYMRQTSEQWHDAYSIQMLARSAELVADICTRYGIPPVRLTATDLRDGKRAGICGHVDVSNGLGGTTNQDPGVHFPWDEYLDMVKAEMTRPDVEVVCGGVKWMVAAEYIYPVGIGEAVEIAKAQGCELPTPALVDAIWKAADLKVEPVPMAPNRGDSAGQFLDHRHHVEGQLAGKSFKLVAGTHKDVVAGPGLYGWHRLDGVPIQPLYTGHDASWKDYSQGLRLCRRVTPDYSTVKGYQARLLELGFDPGPIDGIRGPKTIAAVKAFQKAWDLVVDGIVGPKTIAAMT